MVRALSLRFVVRSAALAGVVIAPLACFPSLELAGDTDAGVDASVPGDDASRADGGVVDTGPVETGAADAATDGSAPPSILTDCVLLLHMDEAQWAGPGAVKDSSGKGNHGSVVGTAAPSAGGKFGRGALLDGNGWIDISDAPSLHASTAVTYAAWVAPTGLNDGGTSPGVISKRRGFGDNVAFTMFFYEGNHAWVDLAATRFHSVFSFPNGAFHHVAVVFDGGAADSAQRGRIYVDGALDATSTATTRLDSNVEDVIVGALPNGGNPYTGRIDEVAIWTRALTDAEIGTLASATGPLQ